MKIKTKSAMYAKMYGAGKKRLLEVLKYENKRAPARAVKKALTSLCTARLNYVHDETQLIFS